MICLLTIIAGIVMTFLWYYNSCRSKGKIFTTISILNYKIKGVNLMVSMSYTQKVSVELSPQDSAGNPAQIEQGTVIVESSDETLCSVVKDPENELKFEILASNNGTVGTAQINISADADLGSGVETITGFIGVEITPKHAVGFGFNIAEPVEQ